MLELLFIYILVNIFHEYMPCWLKHSYGDWEDDGCKQKRYCEKCNHRDERLLW